jgi:WD40 repeat protein
VAVTLGARSIHIWDLLTGQLVTTLTSPDSHLNRAIACTRLEGRVVAVTGGVDGKIRVRDLATGKAIGSSGPTQHGPITAVACAHVAGQAMAVTASDDGTVGFWDLTRRRLLALRSRGHPVTSVACAVVDGRTVVAVTGAGDGGVWFWDPASRRPVASPLRTPGQDVGVMACLCSGGRSVAVTGGSDGTIRFWDVATGQPIGTPRSPGAGPVTSLACQEVNGRTLVVVGSAGGEVHIWDAGSPRSGADASAHSAPVSALASASVQGRRVVVSGGHDHMVRLWDGASGRPLSAPVDVGGVVFGLRWSGLPAGRMALSLRRSIRPSTHLGFAVTPFDVTCRRRRKTQQTLLTGDVRALAATTVDGRPVVVTANLPKDRLGVWDLSRSRLLRALPAPDLDLTAAPLVLACAQLGDDPVLIAASGRRPVRMWNLATGEPTGKPITDHSRIKELAAVTVSGHALLVGACQSGGVGVWDLDTAARLHSLMVFRPGPGEGVKEPFTAADVRVMTCGAADGRPMVAIGDAHAVMRIWDLLTGSQVDEFTFPDALSALSFTDNGDLLVGFGAEVAYLRRIPPRKA